jgi:hypothetical protein
VPTTYRRVALAGLTAVATLLPLVAAAAAPAAATTSTTGTPRALAIVRAMADQGVTLTHRRAEGPGVTVADGLCSHVAEVGCTEGIVTKDASLLRFDTAQHAADLTGCGDTRAERLGRLVVEFGGPPRMGETRQRAYVRAVRTFRANHPAAKNDLDRIQQALMRRGLPMRDAHADDGETRPGLAAGIPGAVDMASTTQVDVIVFGVVRAAEDYAGAADDQVYRRGRVVLSFGNPALLGQDRQDSYAAALRRAMSSTGTAAATFAAARQPASVVQPAGVKGCGG